MQNAFRLTTFVLLLALNGCNKQARVTGRVTDFEGDPIPNATVNVEGTQFRATTNPKGEYSVEFAPGRFTLTAQAPNYLSANRVHELAQPTTLPAAPIKLLRMPSQATWSEYLTKEIPKQSIRHFTGETFAFSQFAEILSLSVDNFRQTGDRELVGTVNVSYRAIMDLVSPNIRSAFLPVSGFDPGHSDGEIWDHRFKIRLVFEEPKTWSWQESLPVDSTQQK